jgi:hypothetical protein
LEIEIDVPVVGTQYSQLNVTGPVTINDANLVLLIGSGVTPAPGTTFDIINNDLTDPVNGTFSGLLHCTVKLRTKPKALG